MRVIDGLYYSEDHEWVKVENGSAYVGITDYAQHSMGDIVYVELPDMDAELKKGDALGVVESVKAASDIYTPVSGQVVKINEELEDSPELINESPYESWIAIIELSDEAELEKLMDAAEYEAFVEEA